MDTLVLIAKAALALILIAAGAAKLADIRGFAVTVRLFVTDKVPERVSGALAMGVAATEIVLGGASFSVPAVSGINAAIFAAGVVFVAISVVGYWVHRGASCRCFGELSSRRFDLGSIFRSIATAGLAAVVTITNVPASATRITLVAHLVLVAVVALVGGTVFTAAQQIITISEPERRLLGR